MILEITFKNDVLGVGVDSGDVLYAQVTSALKSEVNGTIVYGLAIAPGILGAVEENLVASTLIFNTAKSVFILGLYFSDPSGEDRTHGIPVEAREVREFPYYG